MAKVLMLGAGVMGSALTIPARDNNNAVTLVGTPLDRDIIESIKENRLHPKLEAQLPDELTLLHENELTSEMLGAADVLIICVSSPGVEWAMAKLRSLSVVPTTVALVTKGLVPNGTAPAHTYAQSMPAELNELRQGTVNLVGIGGPCIAREIVFRQPTSVVYAGTDSIACHQFADLMRSLHYRVHLSNDIQGVEACAALKNFLAIGVSSTIGQFEMTKAGTTTLAKNPTAQLFNQAVRELAVLCEWLGGTRDSAFDLAGMGDLHVTVGGGRNSRLGMLLAKGQTIEQALSGDLAGETVEGVDTGRVLAPGLDEAIDAGHIHSDSVPLTLAILNAILTNEPFTFNYERLG